MNELLIWIVFTVGLCAFMYSIWSNYQNFKDLKQKQDKLSANTDKQTILRDKFKTFGIKKLILTVIFIIVMLSILDIYKQTYYCTSNVNINGLASESMQRFADYEHARQTKCGGFYDVTNGTYNCQTKDIMSCDYNLSLYKPFWSRS